MFWLTKQNLNLELTVSTLRGNRRAIYYMNKFFYLEASYRSSSMATLVCREYLDRGHASLIVEDSLEFQVWKAIEGVWNHGTMDKLYQCLSRHKQASLTGRLLVHSSGERSWILEFCQGHLVWATGGVHPIRRWRRHLLALCPTIESILCQESSSQSQDKYWMYRSLQTWVEQGYLTVEQAVEVIRQTTAEIFFEILQTGIASVRSLDSASIADPLALIEPIEIFIQQEQNWQQWSKARLKNYSPDAALIVSDAEKLEANVTARLYQKLSQLLDGDRTVRDLAFHLGKTPLEVLLSFAPYLEMEAVSSTEVADIRPAKPQTSTSDRSRTCSPLVACVDDSAWVCQSLEALISRAGYRFLAIQNPLDALPKLLAHKPHLILLDLKMPMTNGYELCKQLRNLSMFAETPIIILTGADGIVDRVRARMVGATDFLSKSVENETIIETLERYLAGSSSAISSSLRSA